MKAGLKLALLACTLVLFNSSQGAFAFTYGTNCGTGVWCCSTIVFQVNPALPSFTCPGGPDWFRQAVNSAALTWGTTPSEQFATQFQPREGTTTTSVKGLIIDGVNSVAMWPDSAPFEPGDVALSCMLVENGCIREADIIFNNGLSWTASVFSCPTSWDLESIALHEFGHWIALGHAEFWNHACNDSTSPVMCSGLNPLCLKAGQTKRFPTDDDIAGLLWAYSHTGIINSIDRQSGISDLLPNASCVYPPAPSKESCPICHCTLCEKPVSCNGITPLNPGVLICPRGEEASYTVLALDTCGNPPACLTRVSGFDDEYLSLDFSLCESTTEPCESQNWPSTPPNGCNLSNGFQFFNLNASSLNCSDCYAKLSLTFNSITTVCEDSIKVKFFDTNGDKCVTPEDYTGGSCNDYNLSGSVNDSDLAIFQQHLNHDCLVQAPGDMNNDDQLTSPDIVLLLNCVFVGNVDGACCGLSYADVSCDGALTPSDLVILLTAVYLGGALGCPP